MKSKGSTVFLYKQFNIMEWWVIAIKMNINVATVKALARRSINGHQCKSPHCNEIKALGHVLGYCKKVYLLPNAQHHRVGGHDSRSTERKNVLFHKNRISFIFDFNIFCELYQNFQIIKVIIKQQRFQSSNTLWKYWIIIYTTITNFYSFFLKYFIFDFIFNIIFLFRF